MIERDNSRQSLSSLGYSESLPWQLVAFSFWVLELVAIFHIATANWLHFSWDSDHYSHLILIPFISAYLLYGKRHDFFGQVDTAPAPGMAAVIALGGLSLILASRVYGPTLNQDDGLAVAMGGVVTLVVAGYVGFLGRDSARAAIFPLGLLFLAVPLPSFALNHIIAALQHGSAAVAEFLFQIVGTPVLRDRLVLSVPDNLFRHWQ